jgi:hypothetical protein
MIICVTKHRNEGNAIDQPSNNIYIYIYIFQAFQAIV